MKKQYEFSWSKGLAILMILQAAGYSLYWLIYESAITRFFFIATDVSGEALGIINEILAVSISLLAFLSHFSRLPSLAFVMGCLLIIDSGAFSYLGGSFGASLALPAHGARFAIPFLYYFWVRGEAPGRARNFIGIFLTLKFAIAATFLAHGAEALMMNPKFLDFLMVFFHHIGFSLEEEAAKIFLAVIGFLDILVASSLFYPRYTYGVLLYMTIWGLVTACMRIVFYPVDAGISEFLVRVGNWGIPGFLLWWHRFLVQDWLRVHSIFAKNLMRKDISTFFIIEKNQLL